MRFRAQVCLGKKPNCNLVKLPLQVFFQNKIANKSVVAQGGGTMNFDMFALNMIVIGTFLISILEINTMPH
jgi:hypothetical protein